MTSETICRRSQTTSISPAHLLGVMLFALLLTALPLKAYAQGSAAPATGSVSPARLNMRSSPNLFADVVEQLPRGAVVEIIGKNDDSTWFRVKTDTGRGWVYAPLIVVDVQVVASQSMAADNATLDEEPSASGEETGEETDREAAPVADVEDTATVTAAAPDEPYATIVPARMNVRGGPGTNYAVVASAANGERFTIVGLNPGEDWYQIVMSTGDQHAWIFADLAELTGTLDTVERLATADLPPASVAAPAATTSSAGAPVAAPNTGTGFGYGVTVNTWQGDKQGTANLVKQLGFTWVKQQIRWEYAEPEPGNVQWQEMDGIVNTMSGNGINTMFSVVTSPPWARPTLGGTGGPPEDFQLFANFLGSIAGRYCGRLQAIEVWNEQNLRREWEGFPLEPASYMDLLKRSYNAIKAACPSMLVISGATTPAGYSDVAFDDIDYLRGMYQNGLKGYSDGIGIHPSGFANPPSVTFEDWTSGNYDAVSHVNHRSFYFRSTLRASRQVMEEFGDTNKRLWPTEFGWGSTVAPFPGYEYEARIDEGTQGRWIVEAFGIMAGSGYVAVPMLWNLNYPSDTEMGAFAVDGRQAFDMLRRMTGR